MATSVASVSISTRSKGIADHAFVSTDCCLDLGPKIVATRLLPAHPTVLDDLLDVSVPLCRSGRGGRARDRGCSRRHDDGGIRMTLGDSLVNSVLIVGAVSREGRDGIGDLVEQRASPRGVIDLFLGQLDRDDFAALAIDADMQFTPGSAAGRAVLFNQPFAGSAELQAGAVHQQMQRAGSDRRSGGTSSVLLRRLNVEWSGTARSSPSRAMTEPMSPSVCRNARPKTARIVSAVVIARVE